MDVVPITQLLAAVGTVLAAIVGAAKVLWDQSRTDLAALRTQLAEAQASRETHHKAELERHTALVTALTESTAALRDAREQSAALAALLEARDAIEDQPKRITGGRRSAPP